MKTEEDLVPNWALLLPLTSKGSKNKEEFLKNMDKLLQSLVSERAQREKCTIFIGYDDDDKVLAKVKDKIRSSAEAGFYKIHFTSFPQSKPAKICAIWKKLALSALKGENDFFLLIGDDIEISSPPGTHWMQEMESEFKEMSSCQPALPFGFGCISLQDTGSPSFPTFPVLHKTHFEIFPEVFPDIFVNQDADPFLFEMYRHFGVAKISSLVHVKNLIGGVELDSGYVAPRYERVHVEWESLLPAQIQQIENWAAKKKKSGCEKKDVVDIIVPSYRVQMSYLGPILNDIIIPETADVMYIVVVDNPATEKEILQKLHAEEVKAVGVHSRKRIRIRVNAANEGASFSRNVGIRQSKADFLLFLDDDVLPSNEILQEYLMAQAAHPDYDGFVGSTELVQLDPSTPSTLFQIAVQLSGITYFWSAPATASEMPWGITANVFFRKSHLPDEQIFFDLSYFKTGGGEDIDYCLQLKKFPLLSVPRAKASHPWWHSGKRNMSRFFYWAMSDSLLQSQYSFLSFPNLQETIIFYLLFKGWMVFWGNTEMLSVSRFVVLCSCLWGADFLLDILQFLCGEQVSPILTKEIFPEDGKSSAFPWMKLLAVFIESNLIIQVADLGHWLGNVYFSCYQMFQTLFSYIVCVVIKCFKHTCPSIYQMFQPWTSMFETFDNQKDKHLKLRSCPQFVLCPFFLRFNWFCGTFPAYPRILQMKQFIKFWFFMMILMVVEFLNIRR
jgi:glycosyltransferase involved in cell wall biosynthesis